MRWNDLNGGSIKALLILWLLAANFAAGVPNHNGGLQPPGSARASRAAFGASPNARTTSGTQEREKFSAGAPKTAREARALPGRFSP
jgi:hypothetical protein